MEPPVALCCYYMDHQSPPSPAIAVASGPHIYIYKNLRPFFKFTLPTPHVEHLELEVWNDLRQDKIDASRGRDALKSLKDKGLPLTSRSLDLLFLTDPTLVRHFSFYSNDLHVIRYKNLWLLIRVFSWCSKQSLHAWLLCGKDEMSPLDLDVWSLALKADKSWFLILPRAPFWRKFVMISFQRHTTKASYRLQSKARLLLWQWADYMM